MDSALKLCILSPMKTLLKGCLVVFVLGLIVTAIAGYYLYQGAKEVYSEAAAEMEKSYKEEEAKVLSAPQSQIQLKSLQEIASHMAQKPAQAQQALDEKIVVLSAFVATEENISRHMPFNLPGDMLILQKDTQEYSEEAFHAVCMYANSYREHFEKLKVHDAVTVRGRLSFDDEGQAVVFPCLPEASS